MNIQIFVVVDICVHCTHYTHGQCQWWLSYLIYFSIYFNIVIGCLIDIVLLSHYNFDCNLNDCSVTEHTHRNCPKVISPYVEQRWLFGYTLYRFECSGNNMYWLDSYGMPEENIHAHKYMLLLLNPRAIKIEWLVEKNCVCECKSHSDQYSTLKTFRSFRSSFNVWIIFVLVYWNHAAAERFMLELTKSRISCFASVHLLFSCADIAPLPTVKFHSTV